jgi:hypothetical protein
VIGAVRARGGASFLPHIRYSTTNG